MSSFWNELKTTKDKVYALLRAYPHLRDNDNAIMANIWNHETKAKSLKEFFQELSDGKIPSSESIRRTRQKYKNKI